MTADNALPLMTTSAKERFWSSLRNSSGDCWTWVGNLTRDGYGQFSMGRDKVLAHRLSWRMLVGPIPTGLCIDHLCRNRACVNPGHMELVTSAENTHRGNAAGVAIRRSGICKRGHDMNKLGKYLKTDVFRATGKRWWNCAECNRIAARKYREAKSAQAMRGA